jgi:hypothetical protein
MNLYLYLCTQLHCRHFFAEFEVKAKAKPVGYVLCPACGCSAEENGFGGERLGDRIIRHSKGVIKRRANME